ncbi:hypothetical protein AMTR_s00020p00246050 [Amborella trichopoda]|uniref:Uncharacterized protein n=1 Tax=Amborella trichopoda TaxID=13333 RepID=W1PVS0_AMBTC|nr:hypothetical protein AMTR_s00020p00246050 [Amborella trichopoda]
MFVPISQCPGCHHDRCGRHQLEHARGKWASLKLGWGSKGGSSSDQGQKGSETKRWGEGD